jgi:hypothetical protein
MCCSWSDICENNFVLIGICVTQFISVVQKTNKQTKETPWPESASQLYLPSDSRLSAKLLPTFADREVSLGQCGHYLSFLDWSRYFFFQVAPQLYSRGWVNPVPAQGQIQQVASSPWFAPVSSLLSAQPRWQFIAKQNGPRVKQPHYSPDRLPVTFFCSLSSVISRVLYTTDKKLEQVVSLEIWGSHDSGYEYFVWDVTLCLRADI